MERYLKYDDTDFCLEITPITRVMAIKAKGSANYGPPCINRFQEQMHCVPPNKFWDHSPLSFLAA